MNPAPASGAAKAFPSSVLSARDECRGVRTLRLSVPKGFSFSAGQWLMVHFPDDPKHARAYSIASSPLEEGFIELSLARAGDLSARLCGLQGGETLGLDGPYGKWVLKDEADPAVLVTGGSGLAPLRSMARYALATGKPRRLQLFYSARTPADILYRAELEELKRRGIGVYASVTRPQTMASGERWDGPTGRLTVATLEREVPDFAAAWYFLCGPNGLVQELERGLLARGLPKERVRTERWGDF